MRVFVTWQHSLKRASSGTDRRGSKGRLVSCFAERSDVSTGHKRRNESYSLGSRFVRISTAARELRSSESVAMPKRHGKKLRLGMTNMLKDTECDGVQNDELRTRNVSNFFQPMRNYAQINISTIAKSSRMKIRSVLKLSSFMYLAVGYDCLVSPYRGFNTNTSEKKRPTKNSKVQIFNVNAPRKRGYIGKHRKPNTLREWCRKYAAEPGCPPTTAASSTL